MLATGVYAWLADARGLGRANAGVVIDHDGATLIDTLMVPSQSMAFGAAVDDLGVLVRRVVLTSSHIEFAGGTERFRLAAFYGTRQASTQLDQPPNTEAYKRLMPDFAREFDDLATRPISHLVAGEVQLTPALAVFPARGQTAENLVCAVEAAGIVFAGAMCSFGVTPLAFQGDPATWADALDHVAALGHVIVPGHGPVGGAPEVREQQAYLRACVAADGDPDAIPPGPWDTWAGREFDAVNVERAAMLARGDTDMPPAMRAALGWA
jgi:cyclase